MVLKGRRVRFSNEEKNGWERRTAEDDFVLDAGRVAKFAIPQNHFSKSAIPLSSYACNDTLILKVASSSSLFSQLAVNHLQANLKI